MTGLCHNRLAILDLSDRGAQPMASQDGRYVIVFNGEIYNWKELRDVLEDRGYSFRTRTDTEVILAGYAAWGENVLERLRGMFAFALYETATGTLFCARDRLGKKPFVYAENSGGFAFASEIPALLAVMREGVKIDTELDHSAIASMLLHNLRHIPDPYTAYRGIRRLRAGHAMRIRNGRIVAQWRYWNPSADAETVARPVTAAAVRACLEEAVELRREADVPVGALLSGGVDSSAIVALAQKRSAEPLSTYALGLDAQDEDLRRARNMANRLGTRHREYYFEPERQWEVFRKLLATYGEPIMLLPLVHTFELCRAIREDGIRVVLAGHGADELFYGYTGHLRTARLSRWLRRLEFLSGMSRRIPEAERPWFLRLQAAGPGSRKASLYRTWAERTWGAIIAAEMLPVLPNRAAEEMAYWGELVPGEEYIDESNFVGLMVENTHSVTTASDLPAMLAGVEMRAPFLDQKLVALALATPASEKMPRNGDLTRLKRILKRAVADLVPAELLWAPKRGFGYGIQERDVLLGSWRKHAERVFSEFPELGVFQADGVRALWKRATGGEAVEWSLVARLFAIGAWLELAG